MFLRNSLLTIHIPSVIVWLGAGAFELFVTYRVARYRETPAEAPLGTPEIRRLLQSDHLPAIATRVGGLVAVGLAVWRPA